MKGFEVWPNHPHIIKERMLGKSMVYNGAFHWSYDKLHTIHKLQKLAESLSLLSFHMHDKMQYAYLKNIFTLSYQIHVFRIYIYIFQGDEWER